MTPNNFPEPPVNRLTACVLVCLLGGCASSTKPQASASPAPAPQPAAENLAELGNFSVSLSVKDINASKEFYEKLGFKARGGNIKQNWIIMQNGSATIGLFQGMFDKNMLTFNPGWDRSTNALAKFEDVRDIQKRLKSQGIQFMAQADENSTGVAHFMIVDPDGNPILVDQHVPRPAK